MPRGAPVDVSAPKHRIRISKVRRSKLPTTCTRCGIELGSPIVRVTRVTKQRLDKLSFLMVPVPGARETYHYCSERCHRRHRENWPKPEVVE